ncbi:MAG: isoprenoid biosynthesis glyoxalase ElbB [Candidatus Caenarcaniphilales bacterium]|nr:isoprenoid biosynthesis glyoxalase ElbB [Candidatus Caenarcaniphilales bacterium]
MKKAAIVLCGCGALDGSEIHEATLTLLALSQRGIDCQCFAPDLPQARVMNFLSKEALAETRNQLSEAARIARGNVLDLKKLDPDQYDFLVMPGGTGAAYNLCNYAEAGVKAEVNPDLRQAILAFRSQDKPIGAICITPVILALVLGSKHNLLLTAGNHNHQAAKDMHALGCSVEACPPQDCLVDTKNKIVSTPAYMNAQNISQVYEGISKLLAALEDS